MKLALIDYLFIQKFKSKIFNVISLLTYFCCIMNIWFKVFWGVSISPALMQFNMWNNLSISLLVISETVSLMSKKKAQNEMTHSLKMVTQPWTVPSLWQSRVTTPPNKPWICPLGTSLTARYPWTAGGTRRMQVVNRV